MEIFVCSLLPVSALLLNHFISLVFTGKNVYKFSSSSSYYSKTLLSSSSPQTVEHDTGYLFELNPRLSKCSSCIWPTLLHLCTSCWPTWGPNRVTPESCFPPNHQKKKKSAFSRWDISLVKDDSYMLPILLTQFSLWECGLGGVGAVCGMSTFNFISSFWRWGWVGGKNHFLSGWKCVRRHRHMCVLLWMSPSR